MRTSLEQKWLCGCQRVETWQDDSPIPSVVRGFCGRHPLSKTDEYNAVLAGEEAEAITPAAIPRAGSGGSMSRKRNRVSASKSPSYEPGTMPPKAAEDLPPETIRAAVSSVQHESDVVAKTLDELERRLNLAPQAEGPETDRPSGTGSRSGIAADLRDTERTLKGVGYRLASCIAAI